MPQSLAKLLVHLVYSTKNRERVLREKAIREELHLYTAGILKEWDSPAILVNSVEDHIHILFCLSKNWPLIKVVEEVKKGSSKWIKTKRPDLRGFQWQNGYGAFSAGQSSVEDVCKYIGNQEQHHRTRTFQEEFRELLKRYQVPFDERYVWD
jgi:REP element-mobilizing transposase RayT